MRIKSIDDLVLHQMYYGVVGLDMVKGRYIGSYEGSSCFLGGMDAFVIPNISFHYFFSTNHEAKSHFDSIIIEMYNGLPSGMKNKV